MKATTEMVKLFLAHGFTLARKKNHPIWLCPCGHTQVVTSGTVGYGSGTANAKAQIRRTLRACRSSEDTTP